MCAAAPDGFYLVAIGSVLLGLLWHAALRQRILGLQQLPAERWLCQRDEDADER